MDRKEHYCSDKKMNSKNFNCFYQGVCTVVTGLTQSHSFKCISIQAMQAGIGVSMLDYIGEHLQTNINRIRGMRLVSNARTHNSGNKHV